MAGSSLLGRLAALQRMEMPGLRRLYQATLGRAPSSDNAAILRKALAWHIQEQALGGYTAEETARLDALAAEAAQPRKKGLLPGTRLVRTWHGKDHVAVVRADGGFEYDGRIFRSLTAIATAITGTKWAGTRFFGLEKQA